MKKILFVLAAAVVLAGSGCVEPVVFAEVFQLRKGQKIYTTLSTTASTRTISTARTALVTIGKYASTEWSSCPTVASSP